MTDPRVDAIWESLAPHIEWARGFSLILLFADHPAPVEQIRARLEASLRTRDLGLRILDPGAYTDAHELTLAALAKPPLDCGALWIPLWWSEPAGVREFLLHRLNERRFLLERDVARPLVLVLPTASRSTFSHLAPDLWVVRSFSDQLPSPIASEPRASEPRASPPSADLLNQAPGPAELEWRRLTSANRQAGIAIADGMLAFQSAQTRGSLWDARRIAIEMVMIAIQGRVEGDPLLVDVGQLTSAAESLDPSTQRTLKIALDCLADVEAEAGNLAVARDLYQRSLALSEALAKADPHSAQAQRDLSVSYNRVGNVEAEAGNLAGARDLYQRSLALRESLAKADPHSAQAQRDLSVSYEKVGTVEAEAGNLAGARDLYQRSLALREALAKADPHSAQAQRDLSVSYEKVGDVEAQAGNLAGARDLYQRSLALNEALAKADPHSAQAQFDVVDALRNLARLAEAAGHLDEARDHLERASAILGQLGPRLEGHAERESIREWVHARLATLTKPAGSSE